MTDPRGAPLPMELKPVDHLQVEALLNQCFPVTEGRSFFDDFPAWTSERALWMGLLDPGGSLAAAAGAIPAEWSIGVEHSPLSVVRIGGVVTGESHRGQGLASRLVESISLLAERAGARGLVLWGQDSPLYRRLGFEPLGRQLRAPLSELVLALDRSPAQLRLEEGFSREVFTAMNQCRRNHGGALLSAAEGEEILKYRNTRWARVLDSEGQLVGYGAFGKGIDLSFQLHEWGGTPQAVGLIGRWALAMDQNAEIMGPQPLLESVFGELPGETIVEPLCLARFFDENLRGFLKAREETLWFWGIDGV